MLAKFGWAAGKGLGADESGKAVPIEANVGLQRGQGIGKGVRTEQSRRDAKARGEVVSSDEEERGKRNRRAKGKAEGKPVEDRIKGDGASWKKQKRVKLKVEHKTYEQLIAEAGEGVAQDTGLVLDARGGEVRVSLFLPKRFADSAFGPAQGSILCRGRHGILPLDPVKRQDPAPRTTTQPPLDPRRRRVRRCRARAGGQGHRGEETVCGARGREAGEGQEGG